ncbi:MAG: hypothetical protein K2N16_09845 [Muribaculaceae bacterium]|nr:hypothetical protein [Muribaculaceae bacterium]
MFKKMSVWAILFVVCVIQSKADDSAAFDENQLYTIRNKVTGTSMIIGAPNEEKEEAVLLGQGLGGAMFRECELGKWQILSPCGGVLMYWTGSEYYFRVLSASDYEMEILSYDENYYNIICQDPDGGSYYVASDYNWISALILEPSDPRTHWEIIPLPAGAIIDVPQRIEMTNRTFGSGVSYDPNYYATNVELSDAMGFACAHDVVAETLTFTRELKEGL